MKTAIQFGEIEIRLPDQNSNYFYIFHDLADVFGLDYQSDAVSKLRKRIKEEELKPKPTIDYEADYSSIRTSKAESIFQTVKIINEMATNEWKLTPDDWKSLGEKLRGWVKPKAQKWKVGDVFSIELNDRSYGFGQVLGEQPTCALLKVKSESQDIAIAQVEKANVITILHLMPNSLNDFTWKVIAHVSPIADKDSGPWGSDKFRIGFTSASPKKLETVANYFWLNEFEGKNIKEIKGLIMKKRTVLNRLFNAKKWL